MIINGIEIKAVIFDLDGTLYNKKWLKLKSILSCFPNIITLKAIQDVRKEMRGCDYGNIENLHNKLFEKVSSITKKNIDEISHIYINKLSKGLIDLMKQYKPRANLKMILKKLKSDSVKLAVFSDYPFVKERITSLSIDAGIFDILSDSENYGVFKPSGRVVLHIAETLNTPKDMVLLVGDRDDTDGESAREAGTSFIQIIDKKKHKPKIDYQYTWDEFSKLIGSSARL